MKLLWRAFNYKHISIYCNSGTGVLIPLSPDRAEVIRAQNEKSGHGDVKFNKLYFCAIPSQRLPSRSLNLGSLNLIIHNNGGVDDINI